MIFVFLGFFFLVVALNLLLSFPTEDGAAAALEQVMALNEGPIGNDALKGIYREIMSGNYALQRSVRIAYLGPKATFTHQAAVKQFGNSMEYRPMSSINDVFAEVDKGEADYGVIPIENSAEGVVFHS